jgi:hypothetical protein
LPLWSFQGASGSAFRSAAATILRSRDQHGPSKLSSSAQYRGRHCSRRVLFPDGSKAIKELRTLEECACPRTGRLWSKSSRFPRKEVIQPQLPLRLPCYDFTPVTNPTFGGCLPQGVSTPTSGVAGFRGVTGGVYKARERIHRGVADPRLLATPPSWRRVSASNPNRDRLFGIRSPSRVCSPLYRPM